ncbi:unnamed protein product [Rhizophagus irregularis]|nr:unnamed protein product [Rhizophagus irregularis]
MVHDVYNDLNDISLRAEIPTYDYTLIERSFRSDQWFIIIIFFVIRVIAKLISFLFLNEGFFKWGQILVK